MTKWSEVKWCLYSKRVNRWQLWSKLINLWPFINIKSTLINHPRPIFNLRLFTIIQIWHHFKAQTFLWYFLTPTFPINIPSINFAQLIVNLENIILWINWILPVNLTTWLNNMLKVQPDPSVFFLKIGQWKFKFKKWVDLLWISEFVFDIELI